MSDQENFIANLYPAAAKVSQETGMSKELILAQAAEETGWGQHVLPGTNNIFNIKASPDWHGPTKTFNVWEIEGGKKVWKDQEFRVYGSVEEALRDRVKFLEENPRYAKAGLFDEGTKGHLEKEAAALQKAGYATDPNYAKQLIAVANSPVMQRAIEHAQGQSPAQPTTHAATSHSAAEGVLKQGDHSPEVHTLQQNLSKLGYTDAHGHALKPDSDFGANTKHAVEAFQRDHHLVVDGIAGPKTLHAIQQQTQISKTPGLDSPANPDHSLYLQAQKAVHELDARQGRTPDQQSNNLAAALTVAAKYEGLTKIDQVALSDDGSRAFAVQNGAFKQTAQVQTAEAVHTSIAQSSQALQQAGPQQANPVHSQIQPQVPQQASPVANV